MARVTKCDICGDDINGTDRFKMKGLYLKKREFDWDGAFWKKIDLCHECQVNLILATKARKGTFVSELDGKTYKKDGGVRC